MLIPKILIATAVAGSAWAQTTLAQSTRSAEPANGFRGGLGLGNGVELHAGYWTAKALLYGRVRGKWWGPEAGPKASWTGDKLNTRSRQVEVAGLLGYPLPVGRTVLYGAAGLAYVHGRQLGVYRYSIRQNGGLTTDATHYYAYRDYQALGLPLELGLLLPPIRKSETRFGLAAQANLNPEQSVYCVLLTVWAGTKSTR